MWYVKINENPCKTWSLTHSVKFSFCFEGGTFPRAHLVGGTHLITKSISSLLGMNDLFHKFTILLDNILIIIVSTATLEIHEKSSELTLFSFQSISTSCQNEFSHQNLLEEYSEILCGIWCLNNKENIFLSYSVSIIYIMMIDWIKRPWFLIL